MSVEGYQSNLFIGTGFNLVNIGEQLHKVKLTHYFLSEDLVVTFAGSYIDANYEDHKNGLAIEHLFNSHLTIALL